MDFIEFKEPFIKFITLFNPCPRFKEALNNCESYSQLRNQIYRFSDDITENLTGKSHSDLEYEIELLKDDVDGLKYEIDELQTKLDESLTIEPINLDDVFKINFISQYHKQYTAWELELLFKNGKKYLNNN